MDSLVHSAEDDQWGEENVVLITIGNCLPGDPSQDDGRNVGLLPALFPEDSNKWVNEAG